MNPETERTSSRLLKSVLHNAGVVAVGFALAFAGVGIDGLAGLANFASPPTIGVGGLLVALGFLLRAWATFLFYGRGMKVISLVPQGRLITSGPYRFTRNPLYLGGNVFIFGGAALALGSPGGLILTALNVPIVDFMIRREEGQMEREFGEEWVTYRDRVRRWL